MVSGLDSVFKTAMGDTILRYSHNPVWTHSRAVKRHHSNHSTESATRCDSLSCVPMITYVFMSDYSCILSGFQTALESRRCYRRSELLLHTQLIASRFFSVVH